MEGERAERIHAIVYSCDSREELAERIVRLEELVVQAHECKTNDGCCEDCYQDNGCCPIERDMEELGIEVERWIS